MSIRLERDGIFMARPTSWGLRKAGQSQSAAINIGFTILAQLDGAEWTDWSPYDEHYVYGDFYVIKRDGTVNKTTVENLAQSIGWMGDLRDVDGPVPDAKVQITVKAETYENVTRWKVQWINHESFTPQPQHADQAEVAQMQVRYGSLLRAAATSALESMPKPVEKADSVAVDAPPHPADVNPATDEDDLPF